MQRIVILLIALSFISCEKDEKVPYPYIEHEVVYMGTKEELNLSSSNQEFSSGLVEIMDEFDESKLNSSADFYLDGAVYDFVDLHKITAEERIPANVWGSFWEDLFKYEYPVGSCWEFSYTLLPSKGGVGIVYFFYAIVTDEDNQKVLGAAIQGNIVPLRTRSISDTQNPIRFVLDGNHPNFTTKALRERD
jgi:hypothetical protein